MNDFWVIWKENGGSPKIKHSTQDAAMKEVERLASTNPGQTFYVLRRVDSCRSKTVVWASESVIDDIPF